MCICGNISQRQHNTINCITSHMTSKTLLFENATISVPHIDTGGLVTSAIEIEGKESFRDKVMYKIERSDALVITPSDKNNSLHW
uniref:Uncharacterized protein n=1 Tax=Arion vulgaris TaxID=1028688 RepID=A0A0B7ABD4_9EUPU